MLIDPAPDPGPGKRIARDVPSRASELPDERANSFGAILARFDRAPVPDHSLPPSPRRHQANPTPSRVRRKPRKRLRTRRSERHRPAPSAVQRMRRPPHPAPSGR
jgi:hypothetical protein